LKIKVALGFVILASILGCNYLRMYPTYTDISVKHRDAVRIYDENDRFFKEWIMDPKKYKLIQEHKQRIAEYIKATPDLSEERKEAMRQSIITTGMNKEQVKVLLGEPSKIKREGKWKQIWIYQEKDMPTKYYWFYEWAKIHIVSDLVTDIETKHINIPNEQPNDYYFGIVGDRYK
jgi:hypothetical protein